MKNRIKKIVAVATILTCAVMMMPSSAQALTADELQAQINVLLAQIQALNDQLAALNGGGTTVTGCTITSFDRNLKQGMSGDDVKCLQIVLNSASDTQLGASGVGSPGNETSYFGSLTKAAVVKFQNKYASEILASWGLTSGTGFVGSTTRAKLNTLLTSQPVLPPSGCECSAWVNDACAAGDCSATQMRQTRTCIPATGAAAGVCDGVATSQCVANSSCEPAPVGAGLTVSLASDNPASTTLVDGQAVASMAKITFANGDSTEAKVTKLKLKKLGIVADATFANVYLFDGALRLTDSASVSSGVITFTDTTGIFKIAAGASKTITVKADVDGTSGETLGVGINSADDVTTDASAVNGTFPVNGNLMSLATATLAGVSFNTTTTPSTADVDPQDDYTIWQNVVTVTTRAVDFTRFSLRKIGSVSNDDLQNFELYVDGVKVAESASLDDNGYVTFDMSASPVRMNAGARTIKVLADIINGSSLTFKFSLSVSADSNFIDSEYSVNIMPQANSTTFSARTTGIQTVNSGTLTIAKMTDSPSGNIVNGAPAATLATYELKAAGENVKVKTLTVRAIFTNTDTTGDESDTETLRNGMLLANDVQIGSTTSLTTAAAGTAFSLGSSLIVEPGSPVVLKVVADVYDNAGSVNDIDATDTLQASIIAGSSNAEGVTSKTTLSIPASAVNANTLTVDEGTLTLAKYTAYANQTMVAPLAAKLAQFTLIAGTTEAVNINTILVNFANATDAMDGSSDLSNVYVEYGDQTTSTKATVVDGDNSWSINYQLAAGSSVDVKVYANVASGATNGSGDADQLETRMRISGVTADSATTASAPGSDTYTSGQLLTFGSGSFSVATAGDTPLAQIVAGDQQVTAGKFKFTAVSDDYTIKEVKVKVGSAAISSAIRNAILKDGDTVLGTQRFAFTSNTIAYFTDLPVAVPANTSKTLTVVLDLGVVSSDSSTSQVNAAVTLDDIKYATSQGTEATDANTEPAGNALYVYKIIPTFTVADLPSTEGTKLSAGASTGLYKFTVAADSQGADSQRNVALKQAKFSVTITDSGTEGTLTMNTFKLFRGTSDITSLVTIQNTSGVTLESTTTIAEGTSTVVVTFDTEETIPAGSSYTYTLKATPSGFITSSTGNDSVMTYLVGDTSAHNGTDVYAYDSATGSIFQLATAAAGTDASDYNVIWSDNSAVSHSATSGSSSADWANGYLVLNLSLDSVGVSAQ